MRFWVRLDALLSRSAEISGRDESYAVPYDGGPTVRRGGARVRAASSRPSATCTALWRPSAAFPYALGMSQRAVKIATYTGSAIVVAGLIAFAVPVVAGLQDLFAPAASQTLDPTHTSTSSETPSVTIVDGRAVVGTSTRGSLAPTG
ncbi:hypothetical protein GCM10010921_05700 [Microbacterium album]|uniref:Uncharacterized protein n=2 Tax=Microbacterium album TaxID=2053191 RepID=A0A917ID10_9MICO|nr:hypothetical protein GCM10010921_05700 [Microbacterium album]